MVNKLFFNQLVSIYEDLEKVSLNLYSLEDKVLRASRNLDNVRNKLSDFIDKWGED